MTTMIAQAVILAGGRGERLRPLTDTVPKPMTLIHGRPFLEYLIDMLKENGVRDIVLLLGYLPEKITDYFGDGSKFGVRIQYSISPVFDSTGTRLRKGAHLFQDLFLLMYADNYWPMNLKSMFDFYRMQNVLASVTIYRNADNITKNNILVDTYGFVTAYDKQREMPGLNGVEVGFFILKKNIFNFPLKGNVSFEKETLPRLIARRELAGFVTDRRYYSIGSIERLPSTREFLRKRKVMLLDRDGVINKKSEKARYITAWKEFEFLPGVLDALQQLTASGYEVYLISNQAGVARGEMAESDLLAIHHHMQEEIERHGGRIRGIYYCPHGWDDECMCRKPKPGLLLRAAHDHCFDITKAVFIGDDIRDQEAGERAGARTILLAKDKALLDIVRALP